LYQLDACIITPPDMINNKQKTLNVDKPVDKSKNRKKLHILVGIDEVGRGPLAGPLAVCVFMATNENFKKTQTKKIFRSVKESKQLSEKQREEWFSKIKVANDDGLVDFSVQFQSPRAIDSHGLTYTINTAINRGLEKILLKNKISPENCLILLDGGLHAPTHFKHQKTIIRGDEKKTIIALASICAKVLRDRRMRVYATKYPQYGFDIHKGYGTRAHYAAINKHGLTPLHRRSFLRKRLTKLL